MKKALVLLLTLSMVFSVFAAEPVANVNVSEFSGNASVTWGIDLDTQETGFSNKTEAALKLNLVDGGNQTSEGDGIWGEIKVKTDGLKIENGVNKDGTAKVDFAKLHFGENAYVGITSGDTKVGKYKLQTAIANEKTTSKEVGDATYTQGIVAGYGNDLFSVDVDFRSDESAQYTNAYSFAVDGALNAVDNLVLKAGYAGDFRNSIDESLETGFYVATDYKIGLNDKFYLKPQVGYSHAINSAYTSASDDKATVTTKGDIAAALLFGWGDVTDAKPGVYFIDGDADKKIIPGISVAVTKDILLNTKTDLDIETKGKSSPTTLKVAFYSGDIVENLTAVAYYETKFGKEVSDVNGTEVDGDEYEGYSFAAGLKYKLTAGEGTITPQFGIAMANNEKNVNANVKQIQWSDSTAKDGEVLNVKAGVEFAGYVENTTFSVVYASNNLKKEEGNKGTLNFTCKIAF